MFPALGRGQDAGSECSQERCEQCPREPQEQEHPSAHRCIDARHSQCVGDVVDHVPLTGADPVDRRGHRTRLCERRRRVGLEWSSVEEHVGFHHREALRGSADRGPRAVEGGDDHVAERRRRDHDHVGDVEEFLELARLAAREERLRLGQIDGAGHRESERRRAAGNRQLDLGPRLHAERASRLDAEQRSRARELTRDDPDRRVVIDIALIEREDPDRVGHAGALPCERAGWQVDHAESVGRRDAGDRGHPREELVQHQHRWCVRRDRDLLLVARYGGTHRQAAHIEPCLDRLDRVRDRDRGTRVEASDGHPEARDAVRERAVTVDVRLVGPIQRRRLGDVPEPSRRLVPDRRRRSPRPLRRSSP